MLWWCLLAFIFIFHINRSNSLDNGLALTPPMGWMTWGRFRCAVNCTDKDPNCISESLLVRTADEIVKGGYADAGYQYVIVDDCWMKKERDSYGRLVSDEIRFAHGMPYVSKYIHNLGLRFGIYGSYGRKTCEGYAGSLGHEEVDSKLYAEWEVDYLKLDGCFTSVNDLDYGYPAFSKCLNETGRPILFSCSWPYYKEHLVRVDVNYEDVKKYCNIFRTYHDIEDSWKSVKYIINFYSENERFMDYSGPGHWNDPDMLMIGNFGLTVGQSRIQMAIWCILSAPLIMSNDLNRIQPEMKEILLNSEVIAVDQDPLKTPGRIFKNIYGDFKIWKKPVIPVHGDHTSFAIAFVNMNSNSEQSIRISLSELELRNPFGYTVFDLYKKIELVNMTDHEEIMKIDVDPTDVVFYKFQVL